MIVNGEDVASGLRVKPELTPPVWDLECGRVEVWLDNRGRECAYGQIQAGQPWMRVVGVGDFRIDSARGATVIPSPGVIKCDLVDIYCRTVLPMALQLAGHEVLHGSAVEMRNGIVALCARSETGKSTLAYGLQLRGHPLFADDALVFDIVEGRPRLTSVPFAIRLRDESAQHFGAVARREVRVDDRVESRSAEQPLSAICLLERTESLGAGRVVDVERLLPQEAFAGCLPHAYSFDLSDGSRKARMMRSYLALVATVPVLRVRFVAGLENLGAILDELERQISAATGTAAASSMSSAPSPAGASTSLGEIEALPGNPAQDQVREKDTLRSSKSTLSTRQPSSIQTRA